MSKFVKICFMSPHHVFDLLLLKSHITTFLLVSLVSGIFTSLFHNLIMHIFLLVDMAVVDSEGAGVCTSLLWASTFI